LLKDAAKFLESKPKSLHYIRRITTKHATN